MVEPATILRWHRAAFRSYWRWKSRKRVGRPWIDRELRDLIRDRPISPRSPWHNLYAERQQIVEAVPWKTAPTYLVRDNDGAYGPGLQTDQSHRARRGRTHMRTPDWNAAAGLPGSRSRLRRLQRILTAYTRCYNQTRTHLSLDKDAPLGRAIQRHGAIITVPILSGSIIATRGHNFREGQAWPTRHRGRRSPRRWWLRSPWRAFDCG